MPDTTLADLSHEVRSKNAGPFWVTMELFLRDADGYRVAADETFLNERVIAALYRVDEGAIRIFRIPSLNVVKISFPRPVGQGSVRDRDMHAGQHHVPLARLVVPAGRRNRTP
ncbi:MULTISPECIES: DUF4387 domain-containing protein [unclassified Amycolatopsis]|uniref:DUF4387 domain-containing protein n=1 Tax=unclassified Amycolatopsis TaxID=2618356 RepID=UPI002876E9D2|nr:MULTISPECIES: DUF4387 domain-containing protein [unclassified Amycolatopsis]MDS0139945.1 DUF4387 domain-containing protein [Amycolatopsis sp. 505]MDS0148143.1 DUF4387 domain-containing protein [Amycolatopsis sp. CM201R]